MRTIRLATILGTLATAALLGIVSATDGLGVAGWIAGPATGSVATPILATARIISDRPAILPADWITLTRALLTPGSGAWLRTRSTGRCRSQRWSPCSPSHWSSTRWTGG
jgi:hypothetical protein